MLNFCFLFDFFVVLYYSFVLLFLMNYNLPWVSYIDELIYQMTEPKWRWGQTTFFGENLLQHWQHDEGSTLGWTHRSSVSRKTKSRISSVDLPLADVCSIIWQSLIKSVWFLTTGANEAHLWFFYNSLKIYVPTFKFYHRGPSKEIASLAACIQV